MCSVDMVALQCCFAVERAVLSILSTTLVLCVLVLGCELFAIFEALASNISSAAMHSPLC